MSQYLFRVQLLNKKNSSPLHIVAYYSGQTQNNAFNKEKFLPSTKKQVLYTNLVVPKNEFYNDLPDFLEIKNKKKDIINNARNTLWKNIDYFEKRMDSQFARLFETYVPYFLNLEEVKILINKFAHHLSDSGMIADISIHKTNTVENTLIALDKEQKNNELQDYGCFFLCTLRPFKQGVFANKNRLWNTSDQLKEWRKVWLDLLIEVIAVNSTDNNIKRQWLDKLNMYSENNKQFKHKA